MPAGAQLGTPTPSVNAMDIVCGTVFYHYWCHPNNPSLRYAAAVTDGGVLTIQSGSTANLISGGASFANLTDCLNSCRTDLQAR
jgi:hypothetical protein